MATSHENRWNFQLILLLLLILTSSTYGDLISRCKDTCQSALSGTAEASRLVCDEACQINACNTGCELWNNGTALECTQGCETTFFVEAQVQYCSSGCLYAEDEYAAAITAQIGSPSVPYVVSMESITNDSVDIGWTAASHSAVMYILQWRYVDIEGSTWTSYHPQAVSLLQESVTGLHPYVPYKFRIQWVITPRHVLSSAASVDVTTDPYGPPLSPPIILSLISPSPTTVSLSWRKPNFPSGPIIQHTVTIENSAGYRVVLGIDATSNSHTFVRLVPDTLYTVIVEGRNAVGKGPEARQNITTQPPVNNTGVQPFLVVGVTALNFFTYTRTSYVSFTPLDTIDDINIFPSDVHIVDVENTTITDVAVHYWKNLLFLSDSSGIIHRRPVDISNLDTWNTSSEVIYNSTKVVTLLTVDWLYDHLYFVQENQILRCDLTCSQTPEVLVDRLSSPPTEIQVDPYNGFIYWSELGSSGGIYRLDLVHLGTSAQPKNQTESIVQLDKVETFLIDPTGYQVIFPDASNDTLVSVFLDGSAQDVLRVDSGHVLEYFTNVTSLAYFSSQFVWTRYDDVVKRCDLDNGNMYNAAFMYFEEKSGGIRESEHFYCSEAYHGLDVYHPYYQPIPAPVTPPTRLQVLFSHTTAEVSWVRPLNLASTGMGAWQEWTYEIELTDQMFSDTVIIDSISGLTTQLVNLTAEVEYRIRIRGYSASAKGPWSETFIGTTLKQVAKEPYLVLASTDSIKRIDLDGTGLMNVINQTNVKDLAWDADTLYWCDSTGAVFSTNLTDPQKAVTELPFTSYTEALAVDWFTGRLYRGKSNQQDLAIDSLHAYMYWTTTKTVECSRFSGDQRFDYERISGISDDLIAGLTLDLSSGFLYWFSLTIEDSVQSLKLFRAKLAGTGITDPASTKVEVGTLPSNTERVALSFYSQKLFWINNENEVIIGNVNGNSLATLPHGQGATTLSIIQNTLHPLPDGFSSIPTVIPNMIPEGSIQIVGPWHNFNITWQPSIEVNYGEVFYDVSLSTSSTEVVKEAVFNVMGMAPFQPLTILIQAYTYWGSSGQVTARRTSPMSVPTVPQNPRAFVTKDTNIYTGVNNYSATFRWESVLEPNGVLLGYKVHWGSSMEELMMRTLDNGTTELVVDNLMENSFYYFQVEGFTSIGSGPATTLVNVSTSNPTPPPVVFSIGPNGITQTDTDTQTTTDLLGGESVSAAAMAFIAEDQVLFWADRTKQKVKSSNFDGSNELDLFDINHMPLSTGLAVDWLSRCLYVAQEEELFKYDTTSPTSEKVAIAGRTQTSYRYLSVVVDPLMSRLYWTEQQLLGNIILMTSDLQGQSSRPVLGSQSGRRRRQACNCDQAATVSGAMAIDQSDAQNPELFFADGTTGDIWASDLDGCKCRQVVVATEHAQSGLPPDSLTVDQTRIYWTNDVQSVVASADKDTGQDFTSSVVPSDQVPILAAFGDNLQPYPDPVCLSPPAYTSQAELVSMTTHTLTLNLTAASILPQCNGVSTALVTYTLHYGKAGAAVLDMTKTSTATTVTLEGLDPFTDYTIKVSARNYFTVGEPALGPEAVYRTDTGTPSAPRNVTVTVLEPQKVLVQWLRPLESNGPAQDIRYKVRYSFMANGTQKIGIGYYTPSGNSTVLEYRKQITGLNGGQEYSFLVEAYPESMEELFIRSEIVTTTTFQVPNRVIVISRTSDSINVTWTAPTDGSVTEHRIEYLNAGYQGLDDPSNNKDTENWLSQGSENETQAGMEYTELLTDLTPYSFYHIRAQVTYITNRTYDYSEDRGRIITDTTEAGLPAVPAPPEIVEKTQAFEVRWTKPLVNGPDNGFTYILQAKSSQGSWKTVYAGSLTSWTASNLTEGESYTFQVAGQSPVGTGPYSATSQPQIYTTAVEGSQDMLIIIIVAAVVVVLVLLAVIVIIVVIRRKMKKDAKWKHDVSVSYRPDTELATLRQYPTTIVQKDNSLYAVTTTVDGKEVELPIFPRERLKLITFLGSGAFGEVFEGLALNIAGPDSGETQVAVKTLRQGATDQEKEEFMKEAILMGNFHDKNILGLLGVCLDNDPQFIIMDLMEGGDLLSYLRGARGTSITPCRLSPLDLIDIVIDVAKGCRYLESLKFVHRDLAARNCLVSIKDYLSPNRSVKIGDFGLARDIYKSDYYRKEGEGLLPVRWMAPEALMDGVFTTQSDVWSFGVLVWEVMTLGQQPYPARTNVEVLHYVTAGGRLDRPDNCPDDIHHLMLKCWEKQPEGRPSFHSSLEKLDSYRRKSASMSSGVDNPAFDNESIKYLRLRGGTPSGAEDYLQPMDSAQSLGRRESTDSLAELKAKAHEDARKYQEQQGQDQYQTQGARPKPRSNRDSLGLPQDPADSEPRYTAAPSSFSKATGANIPKPDPVSRTPSNRAAPDAASNVAPRPKKPLNMKGSWVDPKKKEKHMQKAAENKKKREEMDERRRREESEAPSVVVMDEPYLVSKPSNHEQLPTRRAPNPFRQDSGDEADRMDYTNWPKHIEEDPTVYHV